MIRLIALNESVHQEEFGDELTLTEETQGSIAEAEYLRAIRLIHQGKEELALSLFNDLLETKVLNEGPTVHMNLNIFGIRHNCYKNAAIIYEKRGESKRALKYFVSAIKLDQNDVHAMNRLGQLALKSNFLEMSEFAFYRCLKQNSNHWIAVDAILRLVCRNHNILGAYGWAMRIHSKDRRCQLAIDIITEIYHKFSPEINFFKKIWDECPSLVKKEKSCQEHFDNVEWSFNKYVLPVKEDLKIQFSNWLSIGNYIMLAKRYHKRIKSSIFFVFEKNYFQTSTEIDLKTLLALQEEHNALVNKNNYVDEDSHFSCKYLIGQHEATKKIAPVKMAETTMQMLDNLVSPAMDSENIKNRQQTRQTEPIIEDAELKSDSNNDSNNDGNKSKCRRRCSDLHFLEQWSWHKNRRYSSRKKIQDRSKADATLKEYLDKIFSNYLKLTFDNSWPVDSCEDSNTEQVEKKEYCSCCEGVQTVEEFFNVTQNEFNHFKDYLNKTSFDIISLVFAWLKYLSKFWSILIPKEVQTTYREICHFYINYFDVTTWCQFSSEDFMATYQIFLLYLEIDFHLIEDTKSEINTSWKSIYNCLMCYAGSEVAAVDINFESNMIRLLNLAYRFTKYENNLKKSQSYLYKLSSFFEKSLSSFVFHLPNLKNSCLDKNIICMWQSAIKRKLSLNEVPQLFEDKKWPQLVTILSESLMHIRYVKDCEYWRRDLKTQFEIIIQALWSLNEFEACLNWSEKYFHLSVSKYFNETDNTKQCFWVQSINFSIAYIECLVTLEGYRIIEDLGNTTSRLVQNIIKVLSFKLDPNDKHNKASYDVDIKRIWVVLHQVILRDEQNNASKESKSVDSIIDTAEIEDMIPDSFLILFTAHEFLGKQKWCTRENGAFLRYILDVIGPNLRAPSYDSSRDLIYEYLEQVTYCLYGFPTKKTRRHLEDHESRPIEMNLNAAIQLFDIYRPESLPEFNSYKLETISGDMEQLLVKIATLVLKEIDTIPATTKIMQYINCDSNQLLQESDCINLPYKIASIFYLLADYYFKNRDFSKTIKYYTLDLACNPFHLDSWAGMALSKASKMESQLNDFLPIEITSFLSECENIIRCFEQCRFLNPTHTLLWIEYGSFAYTIYSFCSRHLKQLSPKMSIAEFTHIEEQKEKMLNIAFNCFSSANNLQNNWINNEKNGEETHDEKWLCRYMLGKITEKRKEQPNVYLNHYLKAAHYLYESNATYPIKINHSNPTPLSVEALEVYYRVNSAILKFIESETEIDRETGDFFTNVLKNLSSSPFALNKAKIDGNSLNVLKRSLRNKSEETSCPKISKLHDSNQKAELEDWSESNKDKIQKESGITDRYSITEITKHSSSLTYSSVTSSSDSVSDSDIELNNGTKKGIPYSEEELLCIYNVLVNNLEECVTRFPEHFKSIYRLVFHYMNGPENLQDLDRCENLLLGQYTTGLGNQINGIFCDRKSNNIFNGIWRLPSSEIDRPGSFSTHMVKCVSILIQMLVKRNNHKLLIDVGLQLYKTPDNDKRYIKDIERLELYHQSIHLCVQIVREILKKNTIFRDNSEIMNILIDMYKAYKKCVKHMNEKEPLLTQLLIDIYKFYMQNKVSNIPENCNYIDIVIKFCAQEVISRKNQEKNNNDGTKPKSIQNMVLGMNKFSASFEKDTQSKNDNGSPNYGTEYYRMSEISKDDRVTFSSHKQKSAGTSCYQSTLKTISERLSVIPEFKLAHFSEYKSVDDEKQQTSIKLSEFPAKVFSDSEKESTQIRINSKVDSTPPLISENLNSSFILDATNLVSSEMKYYSNFKQTKPILSCAQNLKLNYTNETFSLTDSMPGTIHNSAYNFLESNKTEDKDLKCRVSTSSTKGKNISKPYSQNQTGTMNRMKNMKSSSNQDSQMEYSHVSKLNPNVFSNAFSNNKVTMHSLLTGTYPTTVQSELSFTKQSISESNTIFESATKQYNSGMEIPFSGYTSSQDTACVKTNEDASKLSPTNTLQQLLVNRQKYNESNDAGSATDVIILD